MPKTNLLRLRTECRFFSNAMKELFEKEHHYDEAGLTPEERLKERQGLATKEIVIRIHSMLDRELANVRSTEACTIRKRLTI